LPIAFGGQLIFNNVGVDSDYLILDIPLLFNQKALALLVFIGGYAAATPTTYGVELKYTF
jgi:hypothetical protein